jgi:membrane-associated protease RseP (regulator of RpoE activity)
MSMEKFKQEVVSGGTQREIDPNAAAPNVAGGVLVWVLMFALIYWYSPWAFVFAVALALSIIAHEFGHYWTARRSGMKATQFFLGFGPRIWSTYRNGVEYGVRAIPLGGFVKIIGMTNVDEVPEEEEPFTYRQGSYPRRMWVITAGSVMHLILAFAIIVPVYAFSGQIRTTDRVEIWSVQADTPAAAAGVETGDVVKTIDGVVITSAAQFRTMLAAETPGTTVAIEVQRDGQLVALSATLAQHPNFTETRGFLGVMSGDEERVPLGLGDALVQGPKDLFKGVGQAIVGVAKVLNPVNVWGHLMGTNTDASSRPGTIVGATQMSKDAGNFGGWVEVLVLLATVNLSVGVLNMFPLLPLDGGHAAIATYERIRSRKGRQYHADVNKLMPVAAVCLALIAFMFLTGLYLDLVKG